MGEKKYNFEDDQSVADLLGSLPRVEAPANFDARVRSRIALGRPSSSGREWLIPSAAALSLCAVVLASVMFVYLRGVDQQVADATQPNPAPIVVTETPNPQFAAANVPQLANIDSQPSVAEVPPPPTTENGGTQVSRPRRTVPSRGGGWYDTGVKPSADPIVPIGIPTPGSTPETNVRPPGSVNKISAREVLQLIGLDAEFRDDGWYVKKVSENSLAGRSGVRDGDVVEAIDDTKIVGNTTFESGFNGKNLTVVRNGNRQTISIQNR